MAGIGKPSLKNLSKARPRVLKVIGDTCVYAGSLVTSIGISNNNHLLAYISLGLSVAGFLFTNLYAATAPDYDERMAVEKAQMPPIDNENK